MKSDLSKKEAALDEIFSIFIRLRDADVNGNVKCCTCPAMFKWSDGRHINCGHFMSRRHRATRWEEKNCAGQCVACNKWGAGQQFLMGQYLDKRWGNGTAEMLAIKCHNEVHMDKFIIMALIEEYKGKVNKLKKQKGL